MYLQTPILRYLEKLIGWAGEIFPPSNFSIPQSTFLNDGELGEVQNIWKLVQKKVQKYLENFQSKKLGFLQLEGGGSGKCTPILF